MAGAPSVRRGRRPEAEDCCRLPTHQWRSSCGPSVAERARGGGAPSCLAGKWRKQGTVQGLAGGVLTCIARGPSIGDGEARQRPTEDVDQSLTWVPALRKKTGCSSSDHRRLLQVECLEKRARHSHQGKIRQGGELPGRERHGGPAPAC
jgi:hypothetical protein